MQHDVRLSAAALEILAGTAWAWIIAARISRLAELAQSLLWGAAGEPTSMNIASRRRDLVKAVFLGSRANSANFVSFRFGTLARRSEPSV
jgi:hypothetical protein